MSTDHFKQMFETVKDKMDMHYVQNVETALEFYQEECVYMDYSSSSEIRNEYPFLEARKIEGLVASINNSRTFYAVDDTYRDYFPAVTTLTIYDEAELLKYINGPDAVIIDSVMFEQLSDMFNSSDNDNHILAMEIMANSNYIDSLLYLEMLFKEYSGEMPKLKKQMYGRMEFIRRLVQHDVIRKNHYHHLLGCSLPQEFMVYNDWKFIRSCDTSNPILVGAEGVRYTDSGISFKPENKLEHYFEKNLEDRLEDITFNVHKFRSFIK
jgi:hypothetical protein